MAMHSIGDLARKLGVGRDRASYLVLRHGISPVAVVGGIRVFSDAALEQLQTAIAASGPGEVSPPNLLSKIV